jgi:putative glutamine amidotransferase
MIERETMGKGLPTIGLTLDAEPAGGYSSYPWYAMRQNYAAAIAGAGGVPIGLPHHAELAEAYLDRIAGLVVTGGAFDVDPRLYGAGARHASVRLKKGRTASEVALLRGALARGMPVLGICGGEQLLAVALGGRLIQHIPDEIPGALAHQCTAARHQPAHEIALAPGTLLARILGAERMAVNSSHHQAVADPGEAVVNARAPDGVIEGIEDPRRNFCLGVQWHPEFLVDPAERFIFDALIAACRG